jgi:signal transduction histidine kinase
VSDLVHEVAARRRRVPLVVAVTDEPALATGDADALRRALDHLVANAARHAASKVAVTVEIGADEVCVHVDDDGCGIPENDRERVVRRFVRTDEGRARDSGGAGLGLAVSADVASAHGGRLEIGDSPLGGARVSLIVPRSA